MKITYRKAKCFNKNADLIITIIYRQYTQVRYQCNLLLFFLLNCADVCELIHLDYREKKENKEFLLASENNKHNIELCERNCCCCYLGVGESLHGAKNENCLT